MPMIPLDFFLYFPAVSSHEPHAHVHTKESELVFGFEFPQSPLLPQFCHTFGGFGVGLWRWAEVALQAVPYEPHRHGDRKHHLWEEPPEQDHSSLDHDWSFWWAWPQGGKRVVKVLTQHNSLPTAPTPRSDQRSRCEYFVNS